MTSALIRWLWMRCSHSSLVTLLVPQTWPIGTAFKGQSFTNWWPQDDGLVWPICHRTQPLQYLSTTLQWPHIADGQVARFADRRLWFMASAVQNATAPTLIPESVSVQRMLWIWLEKYRHTLDQVAHWCQSIHHTGFPFCLGWMVITFVAEPNAYLIAVRGQSIVERYILTWTQCV